MKPKRYAATAILFDRRQMLKIGAAGLTGAILLPGCDTLTLPEFDLLSEIPSIVPNEDFYVQSAFGTPEVDVDTHVLRLLNAGEEIATITKAYLESLPARTREHTLQCIGANPRFLFIGNALWEGLPFREILESLDVVEDASAQWMKITGADNYATGLPVTDLDGTDGADPMWLVWRMNGEELPAAHGAPFRFLVPGRYGTKNPKWPSELDFVEEEFIGHWESQDWSQLATYQTNGLILSPPTMAVVGAGVIRVAGSAFSGHTQIQAIDVTTDDGSTWVPADLTYSPADSETPVDASDLNPDRRHIWTTWTYDWELDEPGEYSVQVRVTDETGHSSELDPAGTDKFNGYNAGMEIMLRVS